MHILRLEDIKSLNLVMVASNLFSIMGKVGPNKYIKNANCGKIIGGFVNNESLDKSEVINLYNSSMLYTLYSVENGNFRPISSNKNEAF